MNLDLPLFILASIYAALILVVMKLDSSINRDKFSAVKVLCYFAFVEWFVMCWFSVRSESIQRLIFSEVSPFFHEIELVHRAYALSIVGFLFSCLGSYIGTYRLKNVALTGGRNLLGIRVVDDRHLLRIGALISIAAVPFYLLFLEKIGGLFGLWAQLHMRTTLSAGLGYYQVAYTSLFFIGGVLLLTCLFRRRNWLLASGLFCVYAAIFASTGQRAPVGAFIFALILSWHFYVAPVKRILNAPRIGLLLVLLVFMIQVAQWRDNSQNGSAYDGSSGVPSEIEKLILRLGVIERQVVVLGYFSQHSHWYGSSYLGLMQAYRLRSEAWDKPPVDSGVYLKAIADGMVVVPPVPLTQLQATSWPEGNLAGYMNFSFIGLAILCLLSGVILGLAYQLVLSNPGAVMAVLLYASVSFMGAPSLSPFGLVQLILKLLPLILVGFLFKRRSAKKRL